MLRGRLILGNAARGQQDWQGRLFGASVFRRALHPAEIARHYALWRDHEGLTLHTHPDIAALYLFDEGSGRTVQDRSGFANALRIPHFHRPVSKSVLHPFWRDRPPLRDLVLNFVGFVPFGFLYFLYLQGRMPARAPRNALMALLVAAFISLSIELLQVYLPTRSSTLTDFVCNVGGAALGVLMAQLQRVVLPHKSSAVTSG
jgi:VanZ family protein